MDSKTALFKYMRSLKYLTYYRNDQIFKEESAGIFYNDVVSRIKLELMGSGAVVSGDTVLTGFSGKSATYSPIGSLVVPSTLLSSATSSYITYATNGKILFNDEEDDYLTLKIKEIIRIQSVGGSALIKKISDGGDQYLNIYSPLSYFTLYDEFIQDKVESYNIFNKIKEEKTEDKETEVYIVETHVVAENIVEYRYIEVQRYKEDGEVKQTIAYKETKIEGMLEGADPDGTIYSYQKLDESIVEEVKNICFNGGSDYTEDNIALARELVVTNTINSQTFDKISNPLLAMPEEALEYDDSGNAKVNLQDRVVIIRDQGMKPEQISLESKIEQSQIHKGNITDNIYTSLAINDTALGLTDISQLSGEALRRMMSPTIARVQEKRSEVARAMFELFGYEVEFPEVVAQTFDETVKGVVEAVTGGVMSQKKGTTIVSGEEDYSQILTERNSEDYTGLEE